MGTGKGSMDFWSCRVPVSRIIFELKGELHEKVARDAFRLAGHKLPGPPHPPHTQYSLADTIITPGIYEFVKKGEPGVMGITKMTPENIEKFRTQKAPFPLQKYLPVQPGAEVTPAPATA